MNEIIPNLYIGEMNEGAFFHQLGTMHVLSVMWGEADQSPPGVTNIMTTNPLLGLNPVADCELMNEAADWIHDSLQTGKPVLVHCAFGMERSPLTVMWYLMQYKGMTLDAAFTLVKEKRGMVADRRHWLPADYHEYVHRGIVKQAA